jgi:hypothetical protein
MVPGPFSNTMTLKINCIRNRPTRVPSEAGDHFRGRDDRLVHAICHRAHVARVGRPPALHPVSPSRLA